MNIIYLYLFFKERFRCDIGGDNEGVEHLLGEKCGLWDNRVDDDDGEDDVEDDNKVTTR